MKEVYVMKELLGGYRATSTEEIDQLTKSNRMFIAVDIDCGFAIIHLFEPIIFVLSDVDYEDRFEKLANDYINYVISITGMEPVI